MANKKAKKISGRKTTRKKRTPTPIKSGKGKKKPQAGKEITLPIGQVVTAQYVPLSIMTCGQGIEKKEKGKVVTKDGKVVEQPCGKKATHIKNIYQKTNGQYLGYVAFCPAHKKQAQIADVKADVTFIEAGAWYQLRK